MDEFELEQQNVKAGNPGWWETVIPQLTDDQRASLDRALHNRAIGHSTIATVLKRWGYPVSYQQVGHFRRRYVD